MGDMEQEKKRGPLKVKYNWSAEKKARHHAKMRYRQDTEGFTRKEKIAFNRHMRSKWDPAKLAQWKAKTARRRRKPEEEGLGGDRIIHV